MRYRLKKSCVHLSWDDWPYTAARRVIEARHYVQAGVQGRNGLSLPCQCHEESQKEILPTDHKVEKAPGHPAKHMPDIAGGGYAVRKPLWLVRLAQAQAGISEFWE